MPASLLSLKIRGIRSYSPSESKAQTIDFMPLTLILGSNGNGKTTIIESLKFIISGEEPPLSDARRNFLNSKSSSNSDKRTSYASIQLNFQSAKNDICVAKRDMFQPVGSGIPTITSSYKVADNGWVNVHKQEDWNRTLPLLFNLPSQAMLNNVILCHQEENLWCMGQSAVVKQIFDKIFGCEQYKQEIKNIDAEIKTCKSELNLGQKDLSYEKEKVERKKILSRQLETMRSEIDKITTETRVLEAEIRSAEAMTDSISKKITKLENQKLEISSLKQHVLECKEKEAQLRKSLRTPFIELHEVNDYELNQKMSSHYKLSEETKKRQSQLKQKDVAIEKEIDALEKHKRSIQDEINRLEVMKLRLKDTNESLIELLNKVKVEKSMDQIVPDDIEQSLKALEKHEQFLVQNKSDQSELEDRLSIKQQRLTRSINQLEGARQGFLEKIKNKQNYIISLNDQVAQADPVAKDLLVVTQNLEKMSLIARQMPHSEQVDELGALIKIASDTVKNLVERITKDGLIKVKDEILKETEDVQKSKTLLEQHQKSIALQTEQRSQLESEHEQARSKSKEAHNMVLKFKNIQLQAINYYERYLNEKKLLDSKNMIDKTAQLKKIENQIHDKRKELSLLSAEQSMLTDEIQESFERYEEYHKNVSIREVMQRSKQYHDKLLSLEDELKCDEFDKSGDSSTLLSSSSRLDNLLEELQTEYSKANKKFLDLRDKRSRIGGSKTQISYQMEALRNELKLLSKVNFKYAETLGKVVCNKIVLEDLEKLKECFQQSVITFHNQMIIKINEVLRIRWRQIYRGKDIDHIELVDEEITRGKDKRAFNYYIAMWKRGCRMKMREKSSAGQKALASIILRMTLAELFVKDFAFIALDEPTANLDHANIQSLAKAIGSYVKRRTDRGVNIQWIIITHSDQFLQALNSECSPDYYRVQLDDEGYSNIIRIASYETNGERRV